MDSRDDRRRSMCRAVSEVRSWRGGGVARDAQGSVLEQPNALAKTSKYSNARRESSGALRTGQVSCCFGLSLRTRRNPSGYSVFKYTVRGNHHATSGRLRVIISAVTACHSNARSRRITGVKPKRFNMSGGPYGGKSSLATVRVHRLARAPPLTGKYLDIATDRSVPRSLASSVHARRRGRGRTRLRSGDGHLHRPGTSHPRLSSPSAPNPGMLTLARERTTDRSP